MFVQYGTEKCTMRKWATRHMSWKMVLPVELVKPLLIAAVKNRSRSSNSSGNKGTQFWLGIPVGQSTLQEELPKEKAKRQRVEPKPEQRDSQADLLELVPHVWSRSTQRSEHDVKLVIHG